MPAVNVVDFAFTGYPVTDLAAAREFYEGLLGLKTSLAWEDGGRSWIEYDVGGHTLALTLATAQWQPCRNGPALALEVADFDATVAALRARGTTFLVGPMEVPTCQLAVILDPSGNSLAIHHRKWTKPPA